MICNDYDTTVGVLVPSYENFKDGKDSVLTLTDTGTAAVPVVFMAIEDLDITVADLNKGDVEKCWNDSVVKDYR